MLKPQEKIKEIVWNTLTAGLDPEDDPCGNIDDIKDNTSYAIDVSIFHTAEAILKDIEKIDDPKNHAILVWLKKRWLIPVPDPEPMEIGTCASDIEIIFPDSIYETPKYQKKKLEDEKRMRRRAYE